MKVSSINIRVVALCIFQNNEKILVEEIHHTALADPYYRPIGGTVEYGEATLQTIKREVMEEIGAEVTGLQLIDVLENIFTINDQIGHEIDFIYTGKLKDRALYNKQELDGVEGNREFKAVWKPLRDFSDEGSARLVPDGLNDLLTKDNMNNAKGGLVR